MENYNKHYVDLSKAVKGLVYKWKMVRKTEDNKKKSALKTEFRKNLSKTASNVDTVIRQFEKNISRLPFNVTLLNVNGVKGFINTNGTRYVMSANTPAPVAKMKRILSILSKSKQNGISNTIAKLSAQVGTQTSANKNVPTKKNSSTSMNVVSTKKNSSVGPNTLNIRLTNQERMFMNRLRKTENKAQAAVNALEAKLSKKSNNEDVKKKLEAAEKALKNARNKLANAEKKIPPIPLVPNKPSEFSLNNISNQNRELISKFGIVHTNFISADSTMNVLNHVRTRLTFANIKNVSKFNLSELNALKKYTLGNLKNYVLYKQIHNLKSGKKVTEELQTLLNSEKKKSTSKNTLIESLKRQASNAKAALEAAKQAANIASNANRAKAEANVQKAKAEANAIKAQLANASTRNKAAAKAEVNRLESELESTRAAKNAELASEKAKVANLSTKLETEIQQKGTNSQAASNLRAQLEAAMKSVNETTAELRSVRANKNAKNVELVDAKKSAERKQTAIIRLVKNRKEFKTELANLKRQHHKLSKTELMAQAKMAEKLAAKEQELFNSVSKTQAERNALTKEVNSLRQKIISIEKGSSDVSQVLSEKAMKLERNLEARVQEAENAKRELEKATAAHENTKMARQELERAKQVLEVERNELASEISGLKQNLSSKVNASERNELQSKLNDALRIKTELEQSMKELSAKGESNLAALRKQLKNAQNGSNADIINARKEAENLKANLQGRIDSIKTSNENKSKLKTELNAAQKAIAEFEKQLASVKNEQYRKNARQNAQAKKRIKDLSNQITRLKPGDVRTSRLILNALAAGNSGLTKLAMNRVLNQTSVPARVSLSKQEVNKQEYIASELHKITNPSNMYELLRIEPKNTRITKFKKPGTSVTPGANNFRPVRGLPSWGVAPNSTAAEGVQVFNAKEDNGIRASLQNRFIKLPGKKQITLRKKEASELLKDVITARNKGQLRDEFHIQMIRNLTKITKNVQYGGHLQGGTQMNLSVTSGLTKPHKK